MPSAPPTTDELLTMLAATPPRIAALTAGLTPAQVRTAPDHDGWSVTDVLAHLRSCSDVWGDCMRLLVAEDTPMIRPLNPTAWIKQTDYPGLEFEPSFHAFAAQRADLLAFLESLPPNAWSRTGTQKGAGKPLERTVQSFAERLAIHERQHFRQIKRIADAVRT